MDRHIQVSTSETWLTSLRTLDNTVQLDVVGSCAFDGYLNFTVIVSALETVKFSDIQLYMAVNEYSSRFMMGMRNSGGFREVILFCLGS